MLIKEVTRGELVEKFILDEVIAKLVPGEKIPSERELSAELGVAVHTVNKTLATLTERGILTRRKGLGTFVAERNVRGMRVRIVTPSLKYYNKDLVVNWFNSQFILEGFSRRAQELGVVPEGYVSDYSALPAPEAMERLLAPEVAGYLFHIHMETLVLKQWIDILNRAGKIVLCRSHAPFENCNTVYGDMRTGVREAVSYLLKSGRERIAVLEMDNPADGYVAVRRQGYADAHEEAGIVPDPKLFRPCREMSEEEAYAETRKLLAEGIRFDAIFAGTDIRAYGVMRALKEAGLRIPQDVALVGSDNLPQDLETVPTLSTVDYPMHEIGKSLCDVFAEIATGRVQSPVCRALPCKFIKRESC